MKELEPECFLVINNIKKLMYEKRVTQEKLSLSADMSRSNLHYILNGGLFPRLNSLVKIAKALDVSCQELFNEN